MSLCFGIKILCDLSLYFIYAQILCAGFGFGLDTRLPLALLAIAGGLCHALRGRGTVRFVPLLLAPLCLLLLPGLPGLLVLIVPTAYLGATAAKGLFRIEHSECCDNFRRGALLLLPLLILPMFSASRAWVHDALPLVVLYLSCGVLLLRMLRHEPAVLSQPRFIALNSAVLALTLAVTALLSSPMALDALKGGLGWLYRNVVMPPLMLLGYIAAALVWLLMRLFSLFRRADQEVPPQDGEMDLQDKPLFEEVELLEAPEFLKALTTTLFIALCIFAAWRILRRMLGYRSGAQAAPAVAETRSAAGRLPHDERAPRFRPREPRAAVRWSYRRFLLLCCRLGFPPPRDATSERMAEWSKEALSAGPVDRLRQLYLEARYSDREITRSMADEAQQALREMKKEEPKNL